MGWDIERFPEGEVNLELICCICTCILEDPVESPCRHVFCSTCIKTWLSNQKSCPHCRAPVHKKDLKCVVPLLKNIISKQRIYCDNKNEGCPEIVPLERLPSHAAVCQFKVVPCVNEGCMMKVCRQDLKAHIEVCSKRTVLCEKGCEMFLTLGDRTSHNCVQALRAHFQDVTNEMQDRIAKLEELVNVLVTKSNTSHNADLSAPRNNLGDLAVSYSIPSPRSFANLPPHQPLFQPLRPSSNQVTGLNPENNDFSDSVESVESELLEQDNDIDNAGIVPYSTAVHGDDYGTRSQRPDQPNRDSVMGDERSTSPSLRRTHDAFEPRSDAFEPRSDAFDTRERDRQRTERIRDTERTSAIRSRSSHSRRRSDPYLRPRPSSGSTSSRASRDSRIERESRSYPYYEREGRRSGGGGGGGGVNGGGGIGNGGVSSTSSTGGGSGANNNNTNPGEGDQEPLILRIGVSSQTVTDSSTSSASSSDTENEE